MNDAVAILGELGSRLDTRIAELQDRSGGPEHLALMRHRYVGLMETAQLGDQIVTDTDDRVIPVGEAIATAGGSDWIAEDKQFNATD
jgi:hypothetical protein